MQLGSPNGDCVRPIHVQVNQVVLPYILVGQMKIDSLKRPKPEKMASISEEKTKTKNLMVRHTNLD